METDSWMNCSTNCSSDYWSIEENSTTVTTVSTYWRVNLTVSDYIQAAIYWMIFFVGVAGNLLVLAVAIWKLVKSPQHQAMTTFVGSLAVSDLGMLLWVTWVLAILSVNREWQFGKLTCQMYILWRSLTVDSSIVTLMIISVDRFVVTDIRGNTSFILVLKT